MEQLKTFASGARSSGAAIRFDLVPRSFFERVARRFGLGAEKYSEREYRKGLRDRAFIIDRLNHLQAHVQALVAPQNVEEYNDDNTAAIGWAAAFICEVEGDRIGKQILAQIRAERGQGMQLAEKSAAADLVMLPRQIIAAGRSGHVGAIAKTVVNRHREAATRRPKRGK